MVEAVDIVPTLLNLAGIQNPPTLQGESLADAIMSGAEAGKNAAITEGVGWKTMRTQDYRYVLHADGREMLWHLPSDPGAYRDVADDPAHADSLMRCRHLLLRRLLEMERPLPRAWTY